MNLKQREIDLSIIIPLYKGMKYCSNLLKMIKRNCLYLNLYRKCSVEVIFVNDYPEENIAMEEITNEKDSLPFKVQSIVHEKNLGIHAARITGLKQAAGEYVIMLDQDDFVTEQWLYGQWTKIIESEGDFCVCNGWRSRFRVLKEKSKFGKDLGIDDFLKNGNMIWSPGQVIMKKNSIPKEWMLHIQKCNGADDYLLWIMVLKDGFVFVPNNQLLYCHNPVRTAESIDREKMDVSLLETIDILRKTGYLEENEIQKIKNQMERTSCEKDLNGVSTLGQYPQKCMLKEKNMKFQKMFFLMHDWIMLKNSGICLYKYMERMGYRKIAIHGMGYIGECVYQELYGTDIQVAYAIDRSAVDMEQKLRIIRIEDHAEKYEKVDLILTTVIGDMKEEMKILREKGQCPVLEFAQILLELGSMAGDGWEKEEQ